MEEILHWKLWINNERDIWKIELLKNNVDYKYCYDSVIIAAYPSMKNIRRRLKFLLRLLDQLS